MGHSSPLRVVIVHNRDFDPAGSTGSDPTLASRADVENAARDVERALASRGVNVSVLAVPAEDPACAALQTVRALERLQPDLVFNLCESLGGDARHEAVLPALLDLAGIPYTGSGPQSLGLALRKDLTRRILVAQGVTVPDGVTLDTDDVSTVTLPFPLIVKPTREDASVGISHKSVVHDRRALALRVAEVRRVHRQPALVERFIEGRELYVTLVGNPPVAFPMHEIDFSAMPKERPRIVSYAGKWDPSSVEYHGTRSVRAGYVDEPTRARCEAAAQAAFAALELRDYARVDLRLAADGTPYVIDVNPNCDLSDGAGVSRAASFAGLDYADLLERICAVARARTNNESEHHVHRDLEPSPVDRADASASADAPPPAGDGSRVAGGAGRTGRAVHGGGDLGRARADRRRAR